MKWINKAFGYIALKRKRFIRFRHFFLPKPNITLGNSYGRMVEYIHEHH